MTDERNEHIDQFFREHLNEVDVRYNPAHWDQLSQALAAAVATGTAVATSQTAWQRIVHWVKYSQNLILFTFMAAILIATTLILFKDKETLKQTPSDPVEQLQPIVPVFVSDSFYQAAPQRVKDSLRRAGVVSPSTLDTLQPAIVLPVDTIDTLKVDSLKGFLFW